MINTQLFIERLEKIISFYELSSAAFADKIQVPRSSISHLLNGRNKPSLEFVMKVHDTFEEVSLSWLLYGEGNFPSTQTEELIAQKPPNKEVIHTPVKSPTSKKEVYKVVFFYTDGTFASFKEA